MKLVLLSKAKLNFEHFLLSFLNGLKIASKLFENHWVPITFLQLWNFTR